MGNPNLDLLAELSERVRSSFHIGGQWLAPHGAQRTALVSPETEQAWAAAPLADAMDVDRAVAAARHAFDHGPWPRMSGPERAAVLQRFAAEIRSHEPLFSKVWTAEVGAPVSFAGMFVGVAAAMVDYYAGLVQTYAFEDARATYQGHAQVLREPIGVAALVTPWNAALPILSYKLAPALASGCTVVIKSSPETPFDALLLAECAERAGMPPGVINVITADRDVGTLLVSSPGVDKVSFTGSTAAGRQIGKICLDRMARFTLELGGKSAAVLLDDADLATALGTALPLSIPFSGQICFAQTRIIVPRHQLSGITDAMAQAVSHLNVGSPWDPSTHVGPLLNARQMERVMGYIDVGRLEGARLVTGGGRAEGHATGFFVAPTIFADVRPDMKIAREEIFGPVVSVLAYDNVDEAIALANDSDYGLSGTVFSRDPERAQAVARRLRTGNVSINGFEMAPNVPFGGFKHSGLGREGGPEGLAAFLETKAIYRPGVPLAG